MRTHVARARQQGGKMSEFANDLIGIVSNPGPTIGAAMEKKRWLALFGLILLVTSIMSYITYPVTKVAAVSAPGCARCFFLS